MRVRKEVVSLHPELLARFANLLRGRPGEWTLIEPAETTQASQRLAAAQGLTWTFWTTPADFEARRPTLYPLRAALSDSPGTLIRPVHSATP